MNYLIPRYISIIFILLISINIVQSQVDISCLDNLPDPIDDQLIEDMIGSQEEGCNNTTPIFSMSELSNALSQPPSGIFEGMSHSGAEEQQMINFASTAFNGMSLTDIYECLDIGCQNNINLIQSQIDNIHDFLSILSNDSEFQNDLTSTPNYQDLMLAEGLNPTTWISDIQNELSNIDIASILQDAFGATAAPNSCTTINSSDCSNLSVNINIDNSTCSAIAAVTGGTPPYSFSWHNGSQDPMITNFEDEEALLAGVTDANGCTALSNLTQANCSVAPIDCSQVPINICFNADPISCQIEAVVNGVPSNSDFTYNWILDGLTGPVINSATSGYLYHLSVTHNATGCTSDGTIRVRLDCGSGGGITTGNDCSNIISQSLLSRNNATIPEGVADPNWFLGEIEGLGTQATDNIPNPNASAAINSVNTGVNLYNGKGSFNTALTEISSKDVSMPVSVGGAAGDFKLDDLQANLGNMSVNTGGTISRVVNGLPDEFNGNIQGMAYGYKRGIQPVFELKGIGVRLDMGGPNFLRDLICNIAKKIFGYLIGGNTDLSCDELAELKTAYDDFKNGVNGVKDLANKNLDETVKFSVAGKVRYDISTPNYINYDIYITIPLPGSFKLIITIPLRAGFKMVEKPSPVLVETSGLGSNYTNDATCMANFYGLEELDIDDFEGLTKQEQIKYLRAANKEKKVDDEKFFQPTSHIFLEFWSHLEEAFNTTSNDIYPRYQNKQLDMEYDEYYFDFPGYSGKFIFDRVTASSPNFRNTSSITTQGCSESNWEIQTIPYYDFKYNISSNEFGIESFTIITPEGIQYTFDKKEYTANVSYTLPTFLQYKGEQILNTRTTFAKPTIAREELPFYKNVMGIPVSLQKPKDYMTNYHVELGNQYVSTWHLTEVKSLMSQETITLDYDTHEVTYNSQKNWTHSFPNFQSNGSNFETLNNPSLSPLALRKEIWKNGFGDVTYNITETTTQKQIIKSIDNHRGSTLLFTYEDNPAVLGDKLCRRIERKHNNILYKAWEFDMFSPQYHNPDNTLSCTIPSDYTGGQAPVISDTKEYRLKFDEPDNAETELKFIYNFYTTLSILCLDLNIRMPLKFDITKSESHYYANEVSELGSLVQLKHFLRRSHGNLLPDTQEINRYKAEFPRQFLRGINEIDANNTAHQLVTLKYNDENQMANLPKRFSIQQDIWGYYNGTPKTMLPFIEYTYDNIHNGTSKNTDHFAFYHPDSGANATREGRNWEASFNHARVGQLEEVTLETGGKYRFAYDLQTFPSSSDMGILSGKSGGLRVASKIKDADNGIVQSITYKYNTPKAIVPPIFLSQYIKNKYQNIEQKITTGWKPLNNWLMNKGGYVGYGKVIELFNNGDDGKIEHYFTHPDYNDGVNDYNFVFSPVKNLDLLLKKPLDEAVSNYSSLTKLTYTSSINTLDQYPWQPIFNPSWRYGLEYKTDIFDNNNNLQQRSTINYNFEEAARSECPKSTMYQYLHYGDYYAIFLEKEIYNAVDYLFCSSKLFTQIFNFITKTTLELETLDHLYKYIRRDYQYAMVDYVSEKIETTKQSTTTYLSGGNQTVTQTYEYADFFPRNLRSVTTTNSLGTNTTKEEYYYANDIYANSPGTEPFTTLTSNNHPYYFLTLQIDLAKNYNGPILSLSKLNNKLVGGSYTKYYSDLPEGRVLPEYIWTVKNGKFRLTGHFASYENGMPTSYRLAQFLDGDEATLHNPSSYQFLAPITMKWNNQLQLKERTFEEFTTTNIYNPIFQLKNSTNADGILTEYFYDARQRLEETTGLNGRQTTSYNYTMNPLSVEQSVSYADGTATQGQTQHMDGFGNVLQVERHDGKLLSSATYDNMFRVTDAYTIGSGTASTIYEKSPLSRVLSTTDANNNTVSMEYLGPNTSIANSFGGTKTTDPNGAITYAWADDLGRAIMQQSGQGGQTWYAYDDQSRLTSVTNPIGEQYAYTYNIMGLLATKTIPSQGTTSFWYDRSYRPVATRDANSAVTIMDYDKYYRLDKIAQGSNSFNPSTNTVYNIDAINSFMGTTLLDNEYELYKTWMKQVKEAVLKPDGSILPNAKITTNNNFDDIGRPRVVVNNYSPIGQVTIDNTYNDASLVTNSVHNYAGRILNYRFVYDDLLRPQDTYLTPSGSSEVHIEQLNYNSLDQLYRKSLGINGGLALQNIDFGYDVGGRLMAINSLTEYACTERVCTGEDCCQKSIDPLPTSTQVGGINEDLYFQVLGYDGLNITKAIFGNGCEQGRFSNTYAYDNDHRITAMVSNLKGSPFGDIDDAFNTAYSYDAAGNMKTLSRKAIQPSSPNSSTYVPVDIDQLTYLYSNSSSRLNQVIEGAAAPYNTLGFKTTSSYTYDNNGNMTNDSGKGLSIEYNINNLPRRINTAQGTQEVTYAYGGERLEVKNIPSTGSTISRQKLAGLEINDGNTYISIPNGRLYYENSTGQGRFQYHIKDHLGSDVVWFEDVNGDGTISLDSLDEEVLQRNYYYPFGMNLVGMVDKPQHPNASQYQYNGKELNTDFDINLNDYGARWYDSSIARWTSVDALAEHPNQIDKSPYAYAWNSPIVLDDPDGNCPKCETPKDYLTFYKSAAKQIFNNAVEMGQTVTNPLPAVVGIVKAAASPKETAKKIKEAVVQTDKDYTGDDIEKSGEAFGNILTATADVVAGSKGTTKLMKLKNISVLSKRTPGSVGSGNLNMALIPLEGFEQITKALKKSFGNRITFIQSGNQVTIKLPEGYRLVNGLRSHGQKVYTNGNRWITPDVDGHNGGMFKMYDSRDNVGGGKDIRLGTYDAELNRIGD